ncbi:GNAT family N-acetyltransferase [Sporosarcina limicola]|uniref:Ribosomal protein S18 acetylase RimI-like enzyme n=1 Tax=Sporosarcina limicola TaxID=34101 RepID=A0A927MLJ4_9BACL|nr:GNAT family N-acetyltransferase [Sporosarcina limicola]MBE1555147.1 ribosomal protein S18 acetylase RimI-like enzyme [Sporosarcina limicola]
MIRLMTAMDSVHVQQIARKSWSNTYKGIIPEEIQKKFIDRSFSNAMMIKRMEKTTVLIAECEGIPVGFANFTKTDTDGDSELTAMYILPSHQQIGYGEKLFEYTLSMLKGARQLFIYVDGRNTFERSFYEKQGFKLLEVFNEYIEGYPVETAQYVYYIHNPNLAG